MNKGRAAGIAGGLTMLAAVLWAGWYFFIKTKQDDLAEAREEVQRWESRVTAMRACMFGEAPLSQNSGEALSIREMLPATEKQESCTSFVAKLNRGVAEDTGNMKVEHAWMGVDRAAAKVATAYAVYKSDWGVTEGDRRRGVSDLPTALADLDRARADLRLAAGLPAADASVAGLPVAQILPLPGVRRIVGWDEPVSRSSIIARAMGDHDKAFRVVHRAGGAPVTQETTSPFTALPAGDWALDLRSGPDGALSLVSGDVVIATGESGISPTLALGSVKNGIVVYEAQRPYSRQERAALEKLPEGEAPDLDSGRKLVIASPSGAFPAQTFPIEDSLRAVDAEGNAVVAWTEPSVTAAADVHVIRAAFLRPGTAPKIVEIGAGALQRLCTTTGYGWLSLADGPTIRFTPDALFDQVSVSLPLTSCGDRAAVFGESRSQARVCGKDCRDVELTTSTSHITVADERVVAVRIRDKVVGVWAEGAPPTFYALPEALEPKLVVATPKTLDILAEVNTVRPQDQAAMIVRVPMP